MALMWLSGAGVLIEGCMHGIDSYCRVAGEQMKNTRILTLREATCLVLDAFRFKRLSSTCTKQDKVRL